MAPTPFFCSKKKIGEKRGKRKSFKAKTIKRLSPRLKCYYFSHSRASRIQKLFFSANHGGRHSFSVFHAPPLWNTFRRPWTEHKNVVTGVPQGSILGPLLFLIFINDLCNSTPLLEAILFADDTNLFYSYNNVKELFRTMNAELSHLNDWFCANKLSLNTDKTKYVLFHKAKSKDNLPLVLLDLFINDIKIKRENSLKFLGVMIDENLTWKTHVELFENKISKRVGILFKASHSLNSKSLLSIYFALVHPCINYTNIAWASTNKNHLKRIIGKQRQVARLMMIFLPCPGFYWKN